MTIINVDAIIWDENERQYNIMDSKEKIVKLEDFDPNKEYTKGTVIVVEEDEERINELFEVPEFLENE